MAQHRKRPASYLDAYKAGNSREGTSHHSTVQGKWFARVCPVRTNLKSSCYLQRLELEHPSKKQTATRTVGLVSLMMSLLMTLRPQTGRASYMTYWWVWNRSGNCQEATAPLSSYMGKLCLENEDRNSKTSCTVFPEQALGTQGASLLLHFSSAMQPSPWGNSLSLPVVGLTAHQSHRNPTPMQRPRSLRYPSSTQHSRSWHLIFSLHLLISRCDVTLSFTANVFNISPSGQASKAKLACVGPQEVRDMHSTSFPFALKMEHSTFTVQEQCNK